MGPVWKLVSGKHQCDRCGREVERVPAVGRVVDFVFRPEEVYCWECYDYIKPLVDTVAPVSDDPYQPVTRPAIP